MTRRYWWWLWAWGVVVPAMFFDLIDALGDAVEVGTRFWWVSVPILLAACAAIWRWLGPAKDWREVVEKLVFTVVGLITGLVVLGATLVIGARVAVALGWTWILLAPFLAVFGGVLGKAVFDDWREKRAAKRARGEEPANPIVS